MAQRLSVFEESFNQFCDDLERNPRKEKQLAFFEEVRSQNGKSSAADVQTKLEILLSQAQSAKLRKIYGSFRTIVDALKNYSGVLEVFVQVQPVPLAIIWGGLKIVVECASRYDDHFDKIKNEIQNELPFLLYDLAGCEDIYGSSVYGADIMRKIIARSYINIFEFCYQAKKLLQSPAIYSIVESKKLQEVVQELRSNWDYLSKIRDGVESKLDQEARAKLEADANSNDVMRQRLVEEFFKLELERSAAKLDREEAVKERERAQQDRMQLLRSRILGDASYEQLNLGIFDSARHLPGTCQWILNHDKYVTWTTPHKREPMLWLYGPNGTGKTFLTEAAIRSIQMAEGKRTAFYFITGPITMNQLLRNIAAQLLDNFREEGLNRELILDPFYTINENSPSAVQHLVKTLFILLPMTYVFIDGLGELENVNDSRSSHPSINVERELKNIIDFFVTETFSSPDHMRLWFSSQDSSLTRKCLDTGNGKLKLEIPLSITDTKLDIRSYIAHRLSSSEKVKTESAKLILQNVLLRDVDGNFLWAKIMIDEITDDLLASHEDDEQLLESIKSGLPRTMTDVYRKVVERIQSRTPHDQRILPLWKIVLSLIVFAPRPLRVGEVQEAVAMIRTPENSDLHKGKKPWPEVILRSCMSLIHQIRVGDDVSKNLLCLSHASVSKFLRKHCNVFEDPETCLIDTGIPRKCCMLYLQQPRYGQLLQKHADGDFWAKDGKSIKKHEFLLYAAKYWAAHYDLWNFSHPKSAHDGSDGPLWNLLSQ
ncbi:hypothetical protein F5Y08DRAFT_351042 [Xylaria arbuscula]|nr:hypothetical protein F5Y08DRAFT_351042 [Xylaria arbuscula]